MWTNDRRVTFANKFEPITTEQLTIRHKLTNYETWEWGTSVTELYTTVGNAFLQESCCPQICLNKYIIDCLHHKLDLLCICGTSEMDIHSIAATSVKRNEDGFEVLASCIIKRTTSIIGKEGFNWGGGKFGFEYVNFVKEEYYWSVLKWPVIDD